MRRAFWCSMLVALFCARPLPAADKDQAREAFQLGVEAFRSGDFRAALEHFRHADQAQHAPAITYNIARTLEQLGRPNAAVLAYEAYIAEAGESGEFTAAATVAIAQIKGKSTRLRIESTPPGAEVLVDGEPLSEPTPVTVLLTRGPHEIALKSGSWTESRTYDAPGGGSSGEIVFVHSEAPAAPPAPAPSPPATSKAPAPPPPPEISGLMGSFGLSLSLYRFVGESAEGRATADSAPAGLVFGLAFDAGWALSTRTALLLRGFGGFGSAQETLASLGALGPILATRLRQRWWFGGGVVFGAGEADSEGTDQDDSDAQVAFQTNLALGPSLELGYVIDQNQNGHWLMSLMPSALFTTSGQESTLVVPLMLGYRWF